MELKSKKIYWREDKEVLGIKKEKEYAQKALSTRQCLSGQYNQKYLNRFKDSFYEIKQFLNVHSMTCLLRLQIFMKYWSYIC